MSLGNNAHGRAATQIGMNRSLPTFLVVGTGRAGTTSLYSYLSEHPEIFMSPIKETRFFAFDFETMTPPGPGHEEAYGPAIKSMDDYKALFKGVTDEKAIGEVSPHYLDYVDSAARIIRHIPNAKILATVRHPAERAFSGYMKQRMEGREPCKTFEDALDLQEARERDGARWGTYLSKAFLGQQLKVYYDTFPSSQIKVILFEEFVADKQETMSGLFEFVGVDPSFQITSGERLNRSLAMKSQRLNAVLNQAGLMETVARAIFPKSVKRFLRTQIQRWNEGEIVPLSDETRGRLTTYFRDDIELLSDTIGRDLSHWLR